MNNLKLLQEWIAGRNTFSAEETTYFKELDEGDQDCWKSIEGFLDWAEKKIGWIERITVGKPTFNMMFDFTLHTLTVDIDMSFKCIDWEDTNPYSIHVGIAKVEDKDAGKQDVVMPMWWIWQFHAELDSVKELTFKLIQATAIGIAQHPDL